MFIAFKGVVITVPGSRSLVPPLIIYFLGKVMGSSSCRVFLEEADYLEPSQSGSKL